ncbi:hypothetical protein ACEWY4_001606 [Coilia grayii]|uniref:PiggyBac transposable element-derived protein domain-containing protein n=1 Tax=Coilia grayii TaxID=363190 RepID=A0ABD1KUL4_9TELE
MANKKLSCDDVLGLLFADSDSEGEHMPSEDDDLSFSDPSSPGAAVPFNGVAEHSAQADTSNPFPHADEGGTNEHGDIVRRRVGGRGSIPQSNVNRAGESLGVGASAFYHAGHCVPVRGQASRRGDGVFREGNIGEGGRGKRGRSMTRGASRFRDDSASSFTRERQTVKRVGSVRRGGRGRGRRCVVPAPLAGANTNDDGWVHLRNHCDEHCDWIKPFDEPIGYKGDKEMSNDNSALNFLSLFLSDDFWDLITKETNRYAHQFLASNDLQPNSRFHEWYDVTIPEMKAFIALHLSMGVVEKHELVDYWSEFWLTYTPGFGKIMSRNRFQIILSFLHFNDNQNYIGRGQPGHDRLFKVRPIIDLIIPCFSNVYGPRKELSLDEMTIAFKGRSTLKLYNPNKPDKYGYKVFVLSEAKSGYVLQWSMYTGQRADEHAEIGASHLVVSQLMAPYTGKGHEVYMDSYYTSPAVATELASKDTGLCGTVSSQRRGMPKALKPAMLPLSKGDDPVFMRQGKMLACAWHDTKRVTMLSTVHGNTCVRKRIRGKHSNSGYREINRPLCVDQYNTFMGGVDTADQRMKTYLFPHRSRKWYNRIFNAILSISMVNAHILYRECTAAPHKAMKVFVQDIITALLEGFSKKEGKRGGRPSVEGGEMPLRLTERHWLRNADDRPDCVVCSDRTRPKGRHQTKYRCSQCGVGLCAVPCNERYHTLKNFKQCHLDR